MHESSSQFSMCDVEMLAWVRDTSTRLGIDSMTWQDLRSM